MLRSRERNIGGPGQNFNVKFIRAALPVASCTSRLFLTCPQPLPATPGRPASCHCDGPPAPLPTAPHREGTPPKLPIAPTRTLLLTTLTASLFLLWTLRKCPESDSTKPNNGWFCHDLPNSKEEFFKH